MSEIRLVGLRKSFGEMVAVCDVDAVFPTASVTCLLGPSGCGKTTLLRMIAGLERQSAGDIYFGGERVSDLPPSRRNIGMVFQYPVVYKNISVYRNIELPLLQEKLGAAERRQRVEQVMELLGLGDSLHKDTSQLDNATRQKVAVARTIARQPRIILFDEPITNVDVSTKLQLKRAFKDLTRQLNQTILYVTHDQTEAMTLADEIVLMQEGRIVQRDSPRTLYNSPNNVFGGWFLGNPGMNFIHQECSGRQLQSALFPRPLGLSGEASGRITVGIRPEDLQVRETASALAVAARVQRKAVVTGGQYLITLRVGDLTLKAKVDPVTGRRLGEAVWLECPVERTVLFGHDGERLPVQLLAP